MADYLLSLRADVSQAKKDIESVRGSVDGVVTAAKAFAAAFIGSKVIGFLKDAVAEATAAEDAVNELKGAFIASGIEADAAAASFQEFAKSIQETTKFSDDQVISLGAQLQALGNFTEQGLKVATAAAIDFAAFYKKDVSTAIQLVGKAANGEVGALSKLGIKVKEGATNAETFANFLQAISRSAGAAERETLTFSGAMAQLQNNASDVLESIGNVIINSNALKGVLQLATKVFIDLQVIVEKNADTIGNVLAAAIEFLLKGMKAVLNVLFESVKGWRLFINAGQQAFAGLIGYAAEFLSYILEIGKFIPGLSGKVEKLQLFLDDVAKGQGKVVSELKDSAEGLLNTGMVSASGGESPMAKSFRDAAKATGPLVQSINQTKQGAEDAKKRQDELNQALKDGSKDISSFIINLSKLRGSGGSDFAGAAISAIGNSVAKGAEGARQAISGVLTTAATAALGPIGQALGPIIDLFTQGPEKVRETITAFIQAIPTIIENIILSIPALLLAIAEQLPVLVQRLADILPTVLPPFIEGLIAAIPQLAIQLSLLMPRIAIAFTIALIKSVPAIIEAILIGIPVMIYEFTVGLIQAAYDFAKSLWDAIQQFIPGGGVVGAVTGGDGGGILGAVGDFFGFAEGGMVPAGYPNDSFPAKLTSGEAVLPVDVVGKLESFLNNGGGGGPSNMTVNLVVGEEQLAKVILNLNRRGYRLQ